MGGSCSTNTHCVRPRAHLRPSTTSSSSSSFGDAARIVHINGYVEDIHGPATAGDMTGKPPKMLLCSAAGLLSFGSQPILPLDHPLQAGKLYFLLPHSVFQSDSSPVDLAALATRLTAIARDSGKQVEARYVGERGQQLQQQQNPRRRASWGKEEDAEEYCAGGGERVRTWKPVLDAIEERSAGASMRTEVSANGCSGAAEVNDVFLISRSHSS